ncbi:unnamed protein product [Prunus armeniaca]
MNEQRQQTLTTRGERECVWMLESENGKVGLGGAELEGRSTDWERKFCPLRVQASGSGTCGIIFALSRASAMRALCFKLREDAKCRKDALIPLDAVQGCSLVVLNLAYILIRAEPSYFLASLIWKKQESISFLIWNSPIVISLVFTHGFSFDASLHQDRLLETRNCFVSWSFFWIFLFSSLLPVVSSPPSPLDHNSVRTISISIACWLAAGDLPLMPVARLTVLQDLEGHLQMRHGNLEGH